MDIMDNGALDRSSSKSKDPEVEVFLAYWKKSKEIILFFPGSNYYLFPFSRTNEKISH